jgi:uncharacterized membrane protein
MRRPAPVRETARPAEPPTAAPGTRAVGSLLITIARLVRLIVGIAVALIVAAILLRVFGANHSNWIVRHIHDIGRWLVTPFHNLFSLKHPKAAIALNWGIAAIVYLIVGSFIASLIWRAAPRGFWRRPRRRDVAAPV